MLVIRGGCQPFGHCRALFFRKGRALLFHNTRSKGFDDFLLRHLLKRASRRDAIRARGIMALCAVSLINMRAVLRGSEPQGQQREQQ